MQEKRSKLPPFDSHAARSAASLRVCFYPQPRALSILLRQWNCDDEPCLQGALPQGQPHANKFTQHMRAWESSVGVRPSDPFFGPSAYLKKKMLSSDSAAFGDGWWRVQGCRLHEYVWMPPACSCSYSSPLLYQGLRNKCRVFVAEQEKVLQLWKKI